MCIEVPDMSAINEVILDHITSGVEISVYYELYTLEETINIGGNFYDDYCKSLILLTISLFAFYDLPSNHPSYNFYCTQSLCTH